MVEYLRSVEAEAHDAQARALIQQYSWWNAIDELALEERWVSQGGRNDSLKGADIWKRRLALASCT